VSLLFKPTTLSNARLPERKTGTPSGETKVLLTAAENRQGDEALSKGKPNSSITATP